MNLKADVGTLTASDQLVFVIQLWLRLWPQLQQQQLTLQSRLFAQKPRARFKLDPETSERFGLIYLVLKTLNDSEVAAGGLKT